jgi:hypothetical protein
MLEEGYLLARHPSDAEEAAALIGLIGGLVLAASFLPFLRRIGLILGGLLLTAGFALLIIAIHYGVNPYHALK